MEIMAIMTGGRILVSPGYGYAMDGGAVYGFFVMTLDAFGHDNPFIPFPVSMGMDIGVTVGTHYILLGMDASVMLGIFFLMTALTPNLFRLDLSSQMLGEIGELGVTTGTTIFTVYRRGEGIR